jgi:hypothetical protein
MGGGDEDSARHYTRNMSLMVSSFLSGLLAFLSQHVRPAATARLDKLPDTIYYLVGHPCDTRCEATIGAPRCRLHDRDMCVARMEC